MLQEFIIYDFYLHFNEMWKQEKVMKVICSHPAKTEMQSTFSPLGGDRYHRNIDTTSLKISS